MGGVLHLTRRFFGSLRRGGPSREDLTWVHGCLTEAELSIWTRMSDPDKRHAVEVAKLVDGEVAVRDQSVASGAAEWAPFEPWFDSVAHRRRLMAAAALLHDSGKNVSQLGTFSRVSATLVRPVASASMGQSGSSRSGLRHRFGQYWRHPEIGGGALERAGSHRLVAVWAAEHHLPESQWEVPVELGRILRDCDDD